MMTALQYEFPRKKTLACTNPVCPSDAAFIIHTRDGRQTPTCTEHIPQYQKPGCRLIRVTDGVPDPTEVVNVEDVDVDAGAN